MGRSLDLRLVFGVRLDRLKHPWYDEAEDDGDHEAWWRLVGGFKPSFYPYDERGEYADGVSGDDPRISAYYEEMRAWERKHPIPFDIEYDGDYESVDIFVCAPIIKNYDEAVDLAKVIESAVLDDVTEKSFREFLGKYYPPTVEPRWMLIPFYG